VICAWSCESSQGYVTCCRLGMRLGVDRLRYSAMAGIASYRLASTPYRDAANVSVPGWRHLDGGTGDQAPGDVLRSEQGGFFLTSLDFKAIEPSPRGAILFLQLSSIKTCEL
jgi:hypothetical protein